jgi:NAD(P)-dependent dehydrogenase (short-subunit alcohol dehydrogenase family)
MALQGLEGKVAIVVGASRGVGRTYALAMAAAGAKVVALARSVEGDPTRPGSLAELAATIRKNGGEITILPLDLTDDARALETARAAVAAYGGVDVLVNNAVWPVRGLKTLDISHHEWASAMQVNIRGPYLFMREAVPSMLARGGGSIVNITSAAAGFTRPGDGSHDGLVTYCVSKAALERLTTWFSAHYETRNIAVNAISPGHVTSYMELSGGEPDLAYWGEPVAWLGRQRPKDGGTTGKILHTYTFGNGWGVEPAERPARNEHILAVMKMGEKDD